MLPPPRRSLDKQARGEWYTYIMSEGCTGSKNLMGERKCCADDSHSDWEDVDSDSETVSFRTLMDVRDITPPCAGVPLIFQRTLGRGASRSSALSYPANDFVTMRFFCSFYRDL